MNHVLEKAKTESKTGKKPLASVPAGAIEGLCAKLDAIHAAKVELDAEKLRIREAKSNAADALASGDISAAKANAEAQADAARHEIYAAALERNLVVARRATWANDGKVVVSLLEKALAEAEKRRAKLVEDELKEAQALGETARTDSAARSFLEKRINHLRVDLANPEKRLGHARCARAVLRDHLIDFGGE